MADGGDDGRIATRMDLNLYLGLPRSPRARELDLGSDLALGSIALSSSSTTEESRAPMGLVAAPAVDVPYSPSNASYDAADLPPIDDLPSMDDLLPAPDDVHVPYIPSYEHIGSSYAPVQSIEQEREEPEDAYSPSNVEPLQRVREHADAPYDPGSPPVLVDGSSSAEGESHVPYSPPYILVPPNREGENGSEPELRDSPPYVLLPPTLSPRRRRDIGSAFSRYQPSGGDGGSSSSRQERLQRPEFRVRRLIESNSRWRPLGRFRTSHPYSSERLYFRRRLVPSPEPPLQLSSGKSKVAAEGIVLEGSEEDSEEKSKGAANFDCNICLDMANEPVVTCCGHLFCWPCLYQWLHVHSEHKECPVCKGEVVESNVTPIYGRGSSEANEGSKYGEDGQPGLKIPPRPRGIRFESFRQQQRQHFRPISRRLEERVESRLRRILDDELLNGSSFERHGDLSMQGIYDIGPHRLLTRLRARRVQREEGNVERGLNTGETTLPRNSTADPQNSSSNSPWRDGMDFWQPFSLYGLATADRLTALTTDLGRVVESITTSTSHYGASASTANPPNPEPNLGMLRVALAADQAPASSTMAIIQGDVAVPNGAAEPNSGGSSRAIRRRVRSSNSSSLDVDGGALNVRKRSRLN